MEPQSEKIGVLFLFTIYRSLCSGGKTQFTAIGGSGRCFFWHARSEEA
jgi:hypothetical protein